MRMLSYDESFKNLKHKEYYVILASDHIKDRDFDDMPLDIGLCQYNGYGGRLKSVAAGDIWYDTDLAYQYRAVPVTRIKAITRPM